MRFAPPRRRLQAFPDLVDIAPVVHSVRLVTAAGRSAMRGVEELVWVGLLDTGAPISVIPIEFVQRTGCPEGGKTSAPVRGFEGGGTRRVFYRVQIGLPGLEPLPVRAIAASNPDRRHITVGRDVLSRLTVLAKTRAGYDTKPLKDGSWLWHYRRRLPAGLLDLRTTRLK